MLVEWLPGPPTSWTLYPPQRGQHTFICHAVLNGIEYAVSLQGGLHAVFVGRDDIGDALTQHDFLTVQDAQEHAERHAYS